MVNKHFHFRSSFYDTVLFSDIIKEKAWIFIGGGRGLHCTGPHYYFMYMYMKLLKFNAK